MQTLDDDLTRNTVVSSWLLQCSLGLTLNLRVGNVGLTWNETFSIHAVRHCASNAFLPFGWVREKIAYESVVLSKTLHFGTEERYFCWIASHFHSQFFKYLQLYSCVKITAILFYWKPPSRGTFFMVPVCLLLCQTFVCQNCRGLCLSFSLASGMSSQNVKTF